MSETQVTWLLVAFLVALGATGTVGLWLQLERTHAAARRAMERMDEDHAEARARAQALVKEGRELRSEAAKAAADMNWDRAIALANQAAARFGDATGIYEEFQRRVRSGAYRYP